MDYIMEAFIFGFGSGTSRLLPEGGSSAFIEAMTGYSSGVDIFE